MQTPFCDAAITKLPFAAAPLFEHFTQKQALIPKLLEERGIDELRHGSRARLSIDEPFFCDSCSNLEIDEAFQISHKLGLDLAE